MIGNGLVFGLSSSDSAKSSFFTPSLSSLTGKLSVSLVFISSDSNCLDTFFSSSLVLVSVDISDFLSSVFPHSTQNLALFGLSAPHEGHLTVIF